MVGSKAALLDVIEGEISLFRRKKVKISIGSREERALETKKTKRMVSEASASFNEAFGLHRKPPMAIELEYAVGGSRKCFSAGNWARQKNGGEKSDNLEL